MAKDVENMNMSGKAIDSDIQSQARRELDAAGVTLKVQAILLLLVKARKDGGSVSRQALQPLIRDLRKICPHGTKEKDVLPALIFDHLILIIKGKAKS